MILKLLVLAAIIVVVLVAFKVVGRLRSGSPRGRVANSGESASSRNLKGEDMMKCAACGNYVLSSRPEPCGREDCPY